MFCYTFISSYLLFARLFLFYFVYMPFLFFGWKGPCGPSTGGAMELLINHRFAFFFSCWFGYAEFFFPYFSESMKNPCQAPLKLNWVHFACREITFSSLLVQPAEGVLSSFKPSSPCAVPVTHCPITLYQEPGVAPRGTKGKGRLSVCVPCDICPSISWTISCLKHRLWDFFPSDPFHSEKETTERTQCFFRDWLLNLHIVQNRDTCSFLLSVFPVPLLLSVGATAVSEILGNSSLQFPVAGQAAIRFHCAGSFVFCQVPEAEWGGRFGKPLSSASTYSWSVHMGVYM